jgi:hypothetical protein
VDVIATGRGLTGVVLLGGLVALGGCGGSGDDAEGGAPTVTVEVGDQTVEVDPSQYCLDGDGQRYDSSPPIIEAVPDSAITLTVSDAVAEAGWGVQVFDDRLEDRIGEVEVGPDTTVFDGINTSDIVPPAFYLVVVQDSDAEACNGLAGAWPVGFIRAEAGGGTPAPTGTETPPATSTPTGG